jgi:hypothetical protein
MSAMRIAPERQVGGRFGGGVCNIVEGPLIACRKLAGLWRFAKALPCRIWLAAFPARACLFSKTI